MATRKALVGAVIAVLAVTSTDALAGETAAGAAANTPTPMPSSTSASTSTSTTTTPAPIATTVATPASGPVSTTTTTQATVEPAVLPPPPVRGGETRTLTTKIHPNRPLLVTGAVVFAGAYVPTAVLTATNDKDRTLYIPIAGPWLSLVDRPSDVGTTETALIVGSGIAQGVGALLAVASIFVPERVPAATIQAAGLKINLSPTSYGRGSAGLGAGGTF